MLSFSDTGGTAGDVELVPSRSPWHGCSSEGSRGKDTGVAPGGCEAAEQRPGKVKGRTVLVLPHSARCLAGLRNI